MKKLIAISIIATLSLATLVGCGGDAPAETSALKDGVYLAEEKVGNDYGWKEFVEITVADGKISNVVVDGKNGDKLKTTDDDYNTNMIAASKIGPKDAFPQIADQYVKSGHKIEEVKTVTGATTTSDFFKAVVPTLEKQMATGDTTTFLYETPAK